MKPRKIQISGDVVLVPLTQGFTAIVDICDISIVENLNWYAHKSYKTHYAARKLPRPEPFVSKSIAMHTAIMSPPDGFEVDHIDGNGLNNRRNNLRWATHKQNCANIRGANRKSTTGRRGVSPSKGRFIAQIKVSGKRIFLGTFDTIEEAATVYDLRARKEFGEFYVTPAQFAQLKIDYADRFKGE